MIVNSLIKAIPSIANVVLVCMMFWLIFSILGVQFFGGRFYKCVDSDNERVHADLVPNRSVCLNHSAEFGNVTWKNSAVNFDNALNGFLALFQVATFEGWIEVMRDAVDAVGVSAICHLVFDRQILLTISRVSMETIDLDILAIL